MSAGHVFSSLAARPAAVEAELRRELLTLVGGDGAIDEAWVSNLKALGGGSFVLDRASLERQHAVHGVTGVLDTGQSLSADLQVVADGHGGGRAVGLYIKKIQAKRWKKTAAALRRDLGSCHNECVFYQEFAGVLHAAGIGVPRCYYSGEQSFHDSVDEEQLAQSEFMLVLESMMVPAQEASTEGGRPTTSLCQHSPLTKPEVLHSLDLIARFHAWCVARHVALALAPLALVVMVLFALTVVSQTGAGMTSRNSSWCRPGCKPGARTGNCCDGAWRRWQRCRRFGRDSWMLSRLLTSAAVMTRKRRRLRRPYSHGHRWSA
eukprot:SAG22_NODE_249_length_13894_cov_60.455455_2_plen_320_part_00